MDSDCEDLTTSLKVSYRKQTAARVSIRATERNLPREGGVADPVIRVLKLINVGPALFFTSART